MTGKELETAKAVAAAFAATERSKRFNEMLSSVNLPSGGIVSGPSELIGEAGPEAIIPLDRLKELIDSVAPGQHPKLIHAYPTDGDFLKHSGLGKILFEEE